MKLRKKLFGTKRRGIISTVAAIALLGATSAAAWIIITGISGSGSGSFGQATESPAWTINGAGAGPVITDTSGTVSMAVNIANHMNASAPVPSVLGTFTSTPSECAGYLTLDSVTKDGGGSVPPGGSAAGTASITVSPALPATCAGGTWDVAFSAP